MPISRLRIAQEVIRSNFAGLYPDIVRRIGIRPLYANLWLTTRCSGQCQTCAQWRQNEHDEMDTREVKNLMLRLRKAGVAIIYFVGGDVFLRDDIFELIQFAAKLGLRTHLTINAYTVTEEIARALAASGVDSVHFSLDTLTADFDEIRGIKDAPAKVLTALRLLMNQAGLRLQLGITATIMKRTIPAVPEVVRFALANNLAVVFNLINFTHHFFATDFSREQYALDPENRKALAALVKWLKQRRLEHPRLMPRLDHLAWILRYFDDPQQRGTPCFQTLLKVCIQPNGDIGPCCSMETAGNLRLREIDDILRSEAYIALLKKALAKHCPGCSCRYNLNLDLSPVSWMREIGLRLRMVRRSKSDPERF